MGRLLVGLVLQLGLLGLAAPALAAEGLDAVSLRDGEKVVVDGRFDEAIWDRAQGIDAFVGVEPTEGFAPRGTTRVRVAADSTQIYFAWECRFDEPTRVRANISERERINQDDQIAIYLDPFGDGRRAYVFWLNPLGIQQDMIVTGTGGWNPAWDAIFESSGRLVEGGFDVEIAIPFRSLRFPAKGESSWKVLFKRKFVAHREYVAWPAVRGDLGNELLQFAPLRGVEPKRSGVGLELQPTVVGRAGQERVEEGAPLTWREPSFPETVDPGFGMKWQATPSLALNLTVNPDFSQIEADPDQIDHNLRYALFLPERRPFFLEGSELFDDRMLYTRSIVDPIYGVKASGKQGRLSVAVLHALDEAPSPSFVAEHETPGFGAEDVEGALSFVSYASAGWDLGKRSKVSLTWSDKELLKDGQLHASYHAVKLDSGIALDPLTSLYAGVGVSETGREGGERLLGMAGHVFLERGARLYGYGLGTVLMSPGFRSENGRMHQPDKIHVASWGHRRFEFDGPLRSLSVGANMDLNTRGLGQDEPLKLDNLNTHAWVSGELPGLTGMRLHSTFWEQLYADEYFQGGYLQFRIDNRALEVIQGGMSLGFGDAVHYGDGTPTFQREGAVFFDIRALRRLRVRVRVAMDLLGKPGEPLDRLWIYRTKTVLSITRQLSLRLIVGGRRGDALDGDRQVLSSSSQLNLSTLLTLVPKPGTSIHVGYGQRLVWSPGEQVETESRDIFIKASLLLRL